MMAKDVQTRLTSSSSYKCDEPLALTISQSTSSKLASLLHSALFGRCSHQAKSTVWHNAESNYEQLQPRGPPPPLFGNPELVLKEVSPHSITPIDPCCGSTARGAAGVMKESSLCEVNYGRLEHPEKKQERHVSTNVGPGGLQPRSNIREYCLIEYEASPSRH